MILTVIFTVLGTTLFNVFTIFIYNVFNKNAKLQKLAEDQQMLIESVSQLVSFSDSRLKESTIAESFKSDDEIGFFFEMLKEIQEQLNTYLNK